MTITNYSELKSNIADWLLRSDLTGVIPAFINLAEARIARELRHWKQEKRVTADLDERYENLPTDWLETISVTLSTGEALKPISAEEMGAYHASNSAAGKPRYYRHTAGQLEFYPKPDDASDVVLTYYARVPALTDAEVDNWLLTDAPDVYLYGALTQAAPYLSDDSRIPVWETQYARAIEALNQENLKSRNSGPIAMRGGLW